MKKAGGKLFVSLIIFLLLIIFLAGIGSVSAEELKVTMEHPFLIIRNADPNCISECAPKSDDFGHNGEWVAAKDLQVGDYFTTIDGRKARITGIRDVVLDKPINVYNLEANPFNDFVVNGIVVHNSGKVNEIERIRSGEFRDYEIERIKKSERDLGLPENSLSLQQKIEIIESHYTANELEGQAMAWQKAKILKSFTPEQRRILICKKDVGFNSGPLRKLSVHDNHGKFIDVLVAGDISSARNIHAIMKGDLSGATPYGPGWKGAKVIVDGETGRMWWWKGDETDPHHLGMTARAYAEQHSGSNPNKMWADLPESEVSRYFGFEVQESPQGIFSARRDAYIEQYRSLMDIPTSRSQFERAIMAVQEQIDNANRITQCNNPPLSVVDRNMNKYPIRNMEP